MPARSRLPHVPALDGLRGLAVAAVLLFHADVPGLPGGHLGVTAFFTLSGFLITALLLVERRDTGRVDLRAFWARRARRLVPALLLLLPLAAVAVHLSPTPPEGVTWDAVAAVAWVANWRFVLDEQTYADVFASPSPFQHTWSLAVEEQFYVVFPLLVVALLGSAAVLRTRRLAAVLALLAVLSTLQMARLGEAGEALGRGYYGTDARVAELLVGALLALACVGPQGLRVPGAWAGPAGLLGLGGLLAGVALLEEGDPLLHRGGLLAVAVCTAAVVAAALRSESLVAQLLSLPALVGLGVVSYGAYLFHWPLYLVLTEEATGADPVTLLLVRLVATVGLAWLSYALLEQPVRRGLALTWAPVPAWAGGAAAGVAVVAVAAGQLALPAPGQELLPPATALAQAPGAAAPPLQGTAAAPPAAPAARGAAPPPPAAGQVRPQARTAPAPVQQPRRPARRAAVPAAFSQDPTKRPVPPVPQAPPGALRVAVVGDSIGANLAEGLQAWAQDRSDVVVYDLAVPACPVSRGGQRRFSPGRLFAVSEACGWWDDPGSQRRRALEQFRPDLVVLQDGVNEVLDRRLPDWSDWRRPGHPQLDAWLVQEYGAARQQWGARLLLTNAPCADWQRYGHFDEVEQPELRVSALNVGVYPRVPGAQVADLHQRLCPGGQYRDDVEGVPDGRYDGFHLTAEASAALARNWLGPLVLQTAAGRGPLG